MGDGIREVRDLTVCTFESAYRHLDRFGRRFGLLVVDEAHHFGSGMRAEALEMAPAPFRLGLTATPATDPESAARLERLLGPTVFCLSVTDLTGRYLAEFDTVVLPVRLDPGEELEFQKEQAVFLAAFRRFKAERPLGTWPEFVEWARTDRAGLRALAAYHRSRAILSFPSDKRRMLSGLLKRNAHRRVLVFTRDNEAAYGISTEHLIPAITCDIKRKERTAVLESFRQGRVRALVSARVLNEGLDLPEAEVAIIVGGAGGTREFVQRVGRVLRPRPGKQAVVYQLAVLETAEARLFRKGSQALSQPVRVPPPAPDPAPGTDPAPAPAPACADRKTGSTCYPKG